MFAISHEVPIALLEKSRSFNDYDYALVHLFKDNPDYFDFFKESIERGRKVILDNSAYELGEPYEIERYKEYIDVLKPTEFILPDYRDDREKTVNAAKYWNHHTSQLRVSKIAVVHGSDYDDFCKCYRELIPFAGKLAFSFESFFVEYANDNQLRIDEVRAHILLRMLREGVIDRSMQHHILGALSPTEFVNYIHYDWIVSADTSNPVLHGLLGQVYTGEDGLKIKSKIKLDSLINVEVDSTMLKNVMYNVAWFREQFNPKQAPDKVEESYDETGGDHYRESDVEVIEMMIRVWGREATRNFCTLNAFKYRMRLGLKRSSTIESDLKKESYYINKAKELNEVS